MLCIVARFPIAPINMLPIELQMQIFAEIIVVSFRLKFKSNYAFFISFLLCAVQLLCVTLKMFWLSF